MSAKILHEQTGLQIRQNEKNKFTVCTLHYTADPAKRSAWWLEEAKAGLTPAKFQQEYEISYTALFGERVFPEIDTHREKIVIRAPYVVIPERQVCYAGLDFGLRNPTSVHIYTILKDLPSDEDPDPKPYIAAVWEHYEPTENMTRLAEQLRACPYWEQVKWVAADPVLFQQRGADDVGGTTQFDQFVKAGLTNLLPGSQDEENWLTMMREHWRDLDLRKPTFRIFDRCSHMIQEFSGAVFQEMGEHLLRTHNYKERMVDKANHALDDCKYFMLMGPRLKPQEMRRAQAREDAAVAAWKRYVGGSDVRGRARTY